MKAQSAKRVARREAQSAKRSEKLEKSRGRNDLGNLFGEDEAVAVVHKNKSSKNAKTAVAEEDMTPGESSA